MEVGKYLIDLFSESKGQLSGHWPSEGEAEWFSGGRIDGRKERIALRNRDGQTLRVDGQLRIAVLAHQDGVTESSEKFLNLKLVCRRFWKWKWIQISRMMFKLK